MDNEEKKIDLECSNCFTENTVHLSSNIKCKKCEESLTGKLYKSFILSAGLMLGIGAISGAVIDDTVNLNRASVKTEHYMMMTCLKHLGNEKGCLCAVESMSGIIDANRARSESWRKKELESRYYDCID